MKATLRLINAYFWKSLYGPIFTMLFPPLLLVILGSIMKVEYVLPGVIACAILFIGVLVVPLSIMEIKKSTLSKNIGVSPVGVKTFTATIIIFYGLVSIVSILLTLSLGVFVFWDPVINNNLYSGIFTWIGGMSLAVGVIIHTVFCLMTGLVVSTFTKTAQQALTVSIFIILPAMFLSGMIVSVDIIATSPAMQWVSRLMPFRYSTGNIVVAFAQTHSFNIDTLNGNKILVTVLESDKYRSGVEVVKNSTNNMFAWSKDWGVSKIADPTQLKNLITDYIVAGNKVGFSSVADIVLKGNFNKETVSTLLSMSNILYYSPERILNTILPLIGIIGFSILVSYKFRWTAR